MAPSTTSKWIALLTAQLSFVAAQSSSPNRVSYALDSGDSFVCQPGGGLSVTNVSDIVTFPVNWEDATQNISNHNNAVIKNVPDPSWAMTITQNDTLETTFWYDTAGQNYSDDLSIEYDACAFFFDNLPENTLRLGQDDPGNCSSTLSSDCLDELKLRASNSAVMWTTYSSPPPYQNLSAGVLPTICGYIRKDLFDYENGDVSNGGTWPKQCQNDLGSGVSYENPDPTSTTGRTADVIQSALTGYNSSILSYNCTFNEGNKTFHPLLKRHADGEMYNVTTRNVYPILSVYFSVANAQRTSFTNFADSTFSCLRATNFTEGSRVSEALPAGTAYPKSSASHLSGGAIAGIVIGVLAAVALVGLGVWFFVRKRKAKRVSKRGAVEDGERGAISDGEAKSPEIDGTVVNELSPVDKKPEMDNGMVAEMGNAQGEPGELYGSAQQPGELYGSEAQR